MKRFSFILVLVVATVCAPQLFAATVSTLADSGSGSLREAVAAGGTVDFAVTGTITLTSGELMVNGPLAINGPGASQLAVERSAAAGTPEFRVFRIQGGSVSISGLAIRNGLVGATYGNGGGILNEGSLTLNDCVVSGNRSTGEYTRGTGVFNAPNARLIANRCVLADNAGAGEYSEGGGLYVFGGVTLNDSTVSGNRGGGFYSRGGGMHVDYFGTGHVARCTFSGNSVAGANAQGGGIYNYGTLQIVNSTLSGNHSGGSGGGLHVDSLSLVTAIRNCTIGGNGAPEGAGIYNNGFELGNLATTTARDSIVAGNLSQDVVNNGAMTSAGYNLFGLVSGNAISPSAGDQFGLTAAALKLGPLADNGGPTQTRALLTGSPAIDAGSETGFLATDQRGVPRPIGPRADIGAFEGEQLPPPNQPPTVNFVSPRDGETFTAPANILLVASVQDPDGLAASATVEFFEGTNSLGIGQLADPGPPHEAPFRLFWPNVPTGNYVLTARVTDSGGASTVSPPAHIRVFEPAIAIGYPREGDTFTTPTNLPIVARVFVAVAAADFLGAITNVEFFANDVKLGEVHSSVPDPEPMPPFISFGFTWTNPPPGSYVLTAKATTDSGAMQTSVPVHITVGPTQPVVNVEVIKADAYELGDGKSRALIFRVTRTGPIDFDLPVSYRVGGTAQNGVDYEELSGRMIISTGASEAAILTYARFDQISEGDETVELAIESPACIAIFPPPRECYEVGEHGAASGVIHDAPPPPLVSIETINPATSEPYDNGFVVPGKFLISRTGPTNGYLLVFLQYGGTASNGVDYRELPRWFVEIPAGQQSAVLDIVALADTLVEGKETVEVNVLPGPPDDFPLLIPIQEYRVDTNRQSGRVIIFDRQTPFVLPTVSIEATAPETRECRLNENCPVSHGRMTIRRAGELDYPLSVYVAFEGTAIRGVDYALVLPDPSQQGFSHYMTLPAGQIRWDLLIDPIDDLLAEGDETAALRLLQVDIDTSQIFPPADYNVDTDHASATVVIHDNDPFGRPVVSLELVDREAAETLINQNNIDWAEFRVLRTGDATRELVVFLNTQLGTARLGEDYWLDGVNNGSTVRFPAGAGSVNVRLYPIDDDFYEGDESVFFHLIAPPAGIPLPDGYEIDFAHSSVAMVIHDNDPLTTRLDITSPRNGQEFQPGDTITLRAQIIGPGSSNSWSVDFFDGDQRLGTTRPDAPIWWGDAQGGPHVITARAINSQGTVLTSAPPVTIQVGPGAVLPVVKIGVTPWQTGEPCPACFVVPSILTIERTAPTNSALTVFLEIDGTATADIDYQVLPTSIEIPAGQRSTQLTLLARDDQLAEGPEVVRVRVLRQPPPLLPPTYFVNVYANEALVVIIDDEPDAPQARLDIIAPANGSHVRFPSAIQLSALAVNTRNEVYGPVEFYAGDQLVAGSQVTATTRPAIPGLPSVHTAYWTNPPVGPYVLTARTRLSFSQSITSPPVNVTVDSPMFPIVSLETFPLQNAQAREFCPPNADCAYPSFVVRRSGPTDADLSVYLSYSGTATAGADYPSLPGRLVIAAGRDAAFLMLVPNDDTLVEGPETVIATFTAVPGHGYIQDPNHASAAITIIDNELSPPVTVVSIQATRPIAEEDSIPFDRLALPGVFTISRTGPTNDSVPVWIQYTGSARAGEDYPVLPAVVTIPGGAASTQIWVEPIADGMPEGLETLLATISDCPPVCPECPLPPCWGVTDPAHSSATIFIRDDGLTRASLVIDTPKDGANFNAGEAILIVATAIDLDGYISRVEFWDGEQKFGESQFDFFRAPYPGEPIHHTFWWGDAAPGPHALTARAVSTAAIAISSAPVPITVGPTSNQPPEVAITQPVNGAAFPLETAIEIVAGTRDPDGYVRKMEFFADLRKIGESSVEFIRPPDPGQPRTFTFVWRHPEPGPHSLTARATDDGGNTATSAPVNIPVATSEPFPIVTVTARDAWAVEAASNSSPNTAAFRVRRYGPTNDALVVVYSLRGTAENGIDYDRLPGLVTIPAGRRSVLVPVTPLPDNLREAKETVVLRLEEPSLNRYRVGWPRVAVALISDPPPPPSGPRCIDLPGHLLHVCFAAGNGYNFRLEASSDLRNWETLCDTWSSDGSWHFIDTEMENQGRRFYRLTPEPVAEADE